MKTIIPINESNRMNGFACLYRLRSDLMMKYTEVSISEIVVQEKAEFESGLRLVILLSGRTEIHFNSAVFELDASVNPQAAFLPLNRSEIGYKVFKKGQCQKELVIFLYPKWIMESYLDLSEYHQFKQHLNHCPIVITQAMIRLINDIISDQDESTFFHMIEKESRLLALLSNAFSQLVKSPEQKTDRVQQLTEALESGKFDGWNLKRMAKYFHTNVTTLQNEFQRYHKISILAYLRKVKLEQAYKALLKGNSVMQAAESAGYANAENFSTAFKRNFGITPSQIKRDKSKDII